MLAKSVTLSLGLFAAGLFAAAPAAAQDRTGTDSQPPPPCQVSAGNDGDCSRGIGRLSPDRGTRPAHAILFFGGSGVRLVRDRRTDAAAPQPHRPPAFALPLRPQ